MRANSENCHGFRFLSPGLVVVHRLTSNRTSNLEAVRTSQEMRTQQQHELGRFFFDYQDDQVCHLSGIQRRERAVVATNTITPMLPTPGTSYRMQNIAA